ncbi:hypothetical protein [Mesorhizobium sp. M1399]|uniref:hypothetical protein n=1 Tax=Mesorhizobium sp. M1399 TaxID=2957096 RepID=UPI00333C5C31
MSLSTISRGLLESGDDKGIDKDEKLKFCGRTSHGCSEVRLGVNVALKFWTWLKSGPADPRRPLFLKLPMPAACLTLRRSRRRLVAFGDLGMDAIYVRGAGPVVVDGNSIHHSRPLERRKRRAADSIARNIGV